MSQPENNTNSMLFLIINYWCNHFTILILWDHSNWLLLLWLPACYCYCNLPVFFIVYIVGKANKLLNRCQIMTDTYNKMFQCLLGSLLNHPYQYTAKNVSMKPLFNLHYLHFLYHLFAQKLLRSWRILLWVTTELFRFFLPAFC